MHINSIYLELIFLIMSGELLLLQDYKLSLYLTNGQSMEIKNILKINSIADHSFSHPWLVLDLAI